MTKIHAVHFLTADMQPYLGKQEKPWKVGDTRSVKGDLVLCENGYHYCPTWEAVLLGNYLYGPIATIVEVDDDGPKDETKGCSRTRTLVGAWNVERGMRLFSADEASRALKAWEKHSGRVAHIDSWKAIKAARAFADGKITGTELSAAELAAESAARSAAESAARSAIAARFARAMEKATGWKALP
jgi:hypothetical protein